MKKSLVFCGVAALALASCTQNEVLDVNESRAIGFDAFVNNNTRAAAAELNKDGLTQFNVFGYHGEDTPDYTNTLVTGSGQTNTWTIAGTAYWQANQAYEFAAYSDGNKSLTNEDVSFADKKLIIKDYTVGSNDLIAAQTSVTKQENISSYQNVSLDFYHLLSQIKFTFINEDSRDYIMKISNLTINANKSGKVEYSYNSTPSVVWSSTSKDDYIVTGLADIAEGELTKEHSTESIMIMPQNTDELTVSFKVTLSDKTGDLGKIAEGDFTASLDIDPVAQSSAWQPGYRYNYKATINGSDVPDIDNPEDKPKKIEFTVNKVEGWVDAIEDLNPSVVTKP